MKNRIFALIIAVLTVAAATLLPVFAYELDESDTQAGAYYLYNIENGAVLAEKNADGAISPSSTAKIMTACIALESGIGEDTVVTVSSAMLSASSGRTMGLKVGDRLTVSDLLYAVVCGGYNDASLVLALSVCDSVEEFVELMNKKAEELGMSSSEYVNPTGLESSGMTTTAADTAILAEYMSENARFVEIGSTKSHTLSSVSTCSKATIANRSSILASYKGMSCFNTGSGSGDYTVIYYKTGGLSYICVVMGASAVSDVESGTNCAEVLSKRLLAHAVNDYSMRTVMSADTVIDTVPVKYSVELNEIDVYLEEDIRVYLSSEIDTDIDLTYSTYLYGELKAPLSAGERVGELVVSCDGRILATGYLTVAEDVRRNAFLHLMDLMKEYLSSRAFLITLLSFAGIMGAYYFAKRRRLEKMYNKIKRSRSRRGKGGSAG